MDKGQLEKPILSGKIGVIATDTIYGLVGSALDPSVVERIYELKKRDVAKPLIVLIGKIDDLKTFHIKIDVQTDKILKKYWPGPVSIILPCSDDRFKYLHRDTTTIAFRLPKKESLLKILAQVGPLVAPSANPEGQPPAKTIAEAKKYFQNKVDFYFDEGKNTHQASKLIKIANGKEEVVRS